MKSHQKVDEEIAGARARGAMEAATDVAHSRLMRLGLRPDVHRHLLSGCRSFVLLLVLPRSRWLPFGKCGSLNWSRIKILPA